MPPSGSQVGLRSDTARAVVVVVAEDSVTMRLRLHPSPPYPFALDLSVRYELGPDCLTVTTRATNIGDADAPWSAGAHPYVTVGTAVVDDAVLQVPARTWLPTGPASREGTHRPPLRRGVHWRHAARA